MRVIFFSEIRWDYLKTRKQQLITRFPKDWQILFLQPYKSGKGLELSPVQYGNVSAVTVPFFFKNFKSGFIKFILSFKLVRFAVLSVNWLWIKRIVQKTGFQHPDLLMCSNIYAAPFVKLLAAKDRLPVIYDMNDNPFGFYNVPEWAKSYFESLCTMANRITMPHESMQKLLPPFGRAGNFVIGNGVDTNAFLNRQVILYAGIVSEWLDLELLEKVARSFPETTLCLAGPVAANVIALGKCPNVEFLGELSYRVLADQIKQAQVCLCPFKTTNQRYDAATGKLFQYFAAGKPIVTIGRPLTEFEKSNLGVSYVALDHADFIRQVGLALNESLDEFFLLRRKFALQNDWDVKAEEMIRLINEVTQ